MTGKVPLMIWGGSVIAIMTASREGIHACHVLLLSSPGTIGAGNRARPRKGRRGRDNRAQAADRRLAGPSVDLGDAGVSLGSGPPAAGVPEPCTIEKLVPLMHEPGFIASWWCRRPGRAIATTTPWRRRAAIRSASRMGPTIAYI